MAETMQSLDQLGSAQAGRARSRRNTCRSSTSRAAPMPPASARTRSRASGSSRAPARSSSTTRPIEVFFARPVLRMLIQQPLVATNRNGQYDVICTVSGGGLSGQAGAVRHGISKALTYFEPDLRGALKRGGFLTRDSPRGRAQEVRPRQGPPLVPVLQALIFTALLIQRVAPSHYQGRFGAPFHLSRICSHFLDCFFENPSLIPAIASEKPVRDCTYAGARQSRQLARRLSRVQRTPRRRCDGSRSGDACSRWRPRSPGCSACSCWRCGSRNAAFVRWPGGAAPI